MVRGAKEAGLHASCEVSPHHLWFAADDIEEENSSFKMNPPLRSQRDREVLREALRDGRIDFVATDHAPHEDELKGLNFKTAAYGTTGLETSLRVLLSLYQSGDLSAERLVEVFSTKPAEFLALSDRFGKIAVGRPMNAVLLDPHKKLKVTRDQLVGQSKNSCFIGQELYGQIQTVFLQGKTHHLRAFSH